MDRLTAEQRSWNMSRVRSRDTKPEKLVRSMLHRMGYRFSLRRKDLPGRPDIVLPYHKTVVFVHGCFWHQHSGCPKAKKPDSHSEFWDEKLRSNERRDKFTGKALRHAGWRVIVIWECQLIRSPERVGANLDRRLRQKRKG